MTRPPPNATGFRTLTNLLGVVVIVGILVGLLWPGLSTSQNPTVKIAHVEMRDLVSAISAYQDCYQHLPLIDDSNTNQDVTFGFNSTPYSGFQKVSGTRLVTNNSDLIVVLMDIDRGVNSGHRLNPQHHSFLAPQMAKDTKSPGESTIDYECRDPWGNPYIISINASGDGWTRDAFYASPVVSSQWDRSGLADNDGAYELPAPVMVWSRGPDGMADPNIPANVGVNKDNVTSWRP